jgi:N-acetylneuraminic acid mutarotase
MATITAGVDQHGFEECGGLLYAVAGEVGGAGVETNKVYAYDPAANTWAAKADYPISVQSLVVRSVGGKLYGIGGYSAGAGAFYKKVYEYDPTSDAWTEKTDAPTAREDMGAAVIGTKIYVFGGLASPALYKCLEIYDTATDTWTTGADMPDYKLLGDFGAVLNGYIYAIGATNTMTDYPTLHPVVTCYKYDPTTDAWSTIADMPAGICYTEVEVFNGRLYTAAGCPVDTTHYSNVMYEYNPNTNTWATLAAPAAVRGAALASYGGALYMCGGYNGGYTTALYKIL